MKIVDVCAFYAEQGGGIRTYVDRKLAFASSRGDEVVVIAPGEEDREESRDGGRVIWLKSPALPLDRRYRFFEEADAVHAALDREEPDLVEASSPWRTASIVADWPGPAPRALVMHADPLAAFAYRWFGAVASRPAIDRGFDWFWRHLRRATEGFDLVVCANRDLSRRLSEGGVPRVETNAMGVEAGVFSPDLRDPALRAQMLARCGLPEDAALLIGVGRHGPEKRWPTVIDACLAAGADRALGLLMVGDGRDRAKLVRHASGNPHVQFLAPTRDRAALARLMASADALIHGCDAETFGMVAAEAVASGLPLIVPVGGGASDLAVAGASETYLAGDALAASAAIARLFARDPVALARAALTAAAGARTMDDHLNELFARYRAIASDGRVAA